jgi:hypothetical protein
MRIWILALALLVACKKEAAKPNLSKMEPEEACRVISKRAFECKDTITAKVSAAMKQAGASDAEVAKLSGSMVTPARCEGVTADEIDPLVTCYDPDCAKLANCYEAMVKESMTPAGGDSAQPTPRAEGSALTAAPVVAATAETFELGNVMPDAWFAKGGGCAKVVQRLAGCAKDKAFLDALEAGMSPEDTKEATARADGMAGWTDPDASCEQLVSVTYPEEGFLAERWDKLAGDDLADCAKLGAAIHDAGGLPGGAMDD